MKYLIFSLKPEIFESFFKNSLIARSIVKKIINYEICDWKEDFGVGNYKKVDDKPFGGGSGMLLMIEPIYQAMKKYQVISPLFKNKKEKINLYPNNFEYQKYLSTNLRPKNLTILLSPRGEKFNQLMAEDFCKYEQISILCGRYEGFDARVSHLVDMEVSIGDYILNGGEVASMAIIEAVSRLLPGFITKENHIDHESFSNSPNFHLEDTEFIIGKRKFINNSKKIESNFLKNNKSQFLELTDYLKRKKIWIKETMPFIEHPQFTKPQNWNNFLVPQVLLSGNHKLINKWRQNWYKYYKN